MTDIKDRLKEYAPADPFIAEVLAYVEGLQSHIDRLDAWVMDYPVLIKPPPPVAELLKSKPTE